MVGETCDRYNCDQPLIVDSNSNKSYGWSDNLSWLVAQQLTNVGPLNRVLGVDTTTIAWMKANARSRAFARKNVDRVVTPSQNWLDAFGSGLGSDDSYFVKQNNAVGSGYCSTTRDSKGVCCTKKNPDDGSCNGTTTRDCVLPARVLEIHRGS